MPFGIDLGHPEAVDHEREVTSVGDDTQVGRTERRSNAVRGRRQERRRLAEQRRRQQLRNRLGLAIIAALVVAGVGYGLFSYVQGQRDREAPAGVQTFADVPRGHTQNPVSYPQTPPVGGEHSPVWQNCGFYAKPVANENAVHSLEHGAVWITYRPDLPGDQIDTLRKLADGQTHVLVSPYPDLPAPVVASAWGRQLTLDSASDSRLDQFVRAFRQGPQTPEPGASCTGGTSATR